MCSDRRMVECGPRSGALQLVLDLRCYGTAPHAGFGLV